MLLLISFSFVIGNISAFSPFHKVNKYLTLPVRRFKYTLSDIENLKNENRKLREEISSREIDRIKLRELAGENKKLRARLDMKLPSPEWKIIWAEILEVYSREILLDKGIADGVEEGSPVFSADKLVGRISHLSNKRSTVALLTHSKFSVGIRITGSGIEGVGEGLPMENAVQLRYIPKHSDVRKGDKVITSGRGGVFPPGLNVGEVMDVRNEPFGFFLKITVKPALDISEIQDAVILVRK